MVFRVLPLDAMSQVLKNRLREHQKPVAKDFQLYGSILASWLHAITYLRHWVAHHQRLCNHSYTKSRLPPSDMPSNWRPKPILHSGSID
ncbi:Abi family protein [Candidatus Nitrotoga sp. BS]|uniref:Abi family protein n=1 Tax=Candidatus Nitrotoga sp. BS TaxID=2890408 RepID=UPI00403E1A67